MASPVAHSLAGAVIYITFRRRREWSAREFGWTILAANLADLDLIPSLLVGDHALFHRRASHSLLAAVALGGFVLLSCRWRGSPRSTPVALLSFTAYLSQLLLDWLSLDTGPPRGIPLFWPLSNQHYMADPVIFLNIERDNPLSFPIIMHNMKAVLWEILLLGPIAIASWLWRQYGASGGEPQRQRR